MFSARRKPCCSPFEGDVGHRDAFLPQCCDHQFGLRWRHDLVLQALEEDDGAVQAVDVMDRRAGQVNVALLRIGADQVIEIAGLELVRIDGQCFEIADAVSSLRRP